MVINGRYRFDIGTTQGLEGFLQLADILIEQERSARSK
jgi:thiol:disulfide interchange protein DsbA